MILNTNPFYPRTAKEKPPKKPGQWIRPATLILVIITVFFSTDFLEFDQDGNPILAPFRKAKLYKELEELDNAEQYALLAIRDQYYPCYNCPGKSTIFLRKGMVFKYGVTRKGETGRYGTWHIDNHLLYVNQFEGTLQECLRQEKLKIYHYAKLPENLSRPIPLIRPPGNKRDF